MTAIAHRAGKTLDEAAYDWMAAGNFMIAPILNYADRNLEATREMLEHPECVIAASDAGAHLLTVCDGALPTFMMTHSIERVAVINTC